MTFRDRLISAVAAAKNQGFTEIHIDNLERFIAADDGDAEHEKDRKQFLAELEIEHAKISMAHQSASNVQEFLADQNTAEFAVKSSILVNGGASIALLAFLGNLATKAEGVSAYSLTSLNHSMLAFVAGVGAAGITAGLRYFSQACYTGSYAKTGLGFKVAAVALWLTSMGLFGTGGYLAYRALL